MKRDLAFRIRYTESSVTHVKPAWWEFWKGPATLSRVDNKEAVVHFSVELPKHTKELMDLEKVLSSSMMSDIIENSNLISFELLDYGHSYGTVTFVPLNQSKPI